MNFDRIAVLGGGAWGTALANVTARAGRKVTLWEYDAANAEQLAQQRESKFLRGVRIEDGIAVTRDLAEAARAEGIVTGRGLGASASAALTTRGFAELVRFGRALGAKAETMMGLSGLGDLILTCSSPQSRNFSFGINLGKGLATKDIHGKTGLAEGAFTAPVLLEMAREKRIDMPIASAIAAVLAGQMSVDEAIESLLARPLRAEE